MALVRGIEGKGFRLDYPQRTIRREPWYALSAFLVGGVLVVLA